MLLDHDRERSQNGLRLFSMKNVWGKTKEAFTQAKEAVVDASDKVIEYVKEKVPDEAPEELREIYNQVADMKRDAKSCRNRIQVLRMNLVIFANGFKSVASDFDQIIQNEDSKTYNESANKYQEAIILMADTYLPQFVETPFDNFLNEIKDNIPLFRETSDIHEKIIFYRRLLSAQSALPEKKVQEINTTLSQFLITFSERRAQIEKKVVDFKEMLTKAKKDAFAALVFYEGQFAKVTYQAFGSNEPNK